MYSDRTIGFAKEFLKSLLADGKEVQPSFFDYEILGQLDVQAIFGAPVMSQSVFGHALGHMIEDGSVECWRDEKGVHYRLNVTS